MDEPGSEHALGLGDGFGQHRAGKRGGLDPGFRAATAGAGIQEVSWTAFITFIRGVFLQPISN